jgi:hypothetical protein
VAEAFELPGRWLVATLRQRLDQRDAARRARRTRRRTRWIQQRINARVFREPALVMENVRASPRTSARCWGARARADADRRALRLVPARDGLLAFRRRGR